MTGRRRVARFTEKVRALIEAADWPEGVKVVVEGPGQSDAVHVYMAGGGARTHWHLDPTDLTSAAPAVVKAEAIRRLEKTGRDPRYTEKSRVEDLAMARLLRGGPVFTTRPTVTNGEVDGIVVMVNGHDLAGIFPCVRVTVDDPEWDLGFWDADTGEWVDADPDGDFSRHLMKFLAKERGTDG